MTAASGGGMGGEVDVAYIDLKVRIDDAERSLREIEGKIGDAGDRAGSSFGGKVAGAIGGLAQAGAVAGAAIAASLVAAAGAAVNAFADFESTMSGAQAVLGATSGEMSKLKDLALEMGAQTSFSAKDAAEAIEQLGSSGLNTASILEGGLQGALNLAAATGLKDIAFASEVAAGALNAFGLQGNQMAKVADTVANAANVSALNVQGFAQAVANGGAVAKSMNVNLDEFTATISLMSDKMIGGAEAGTAFKTFLMRLTPDSKEASKTMHELGFSAFDSAGKMLPLNQIVANLQKSFAGMTEEERAMNAEVLFGADGVRAFNVLLEAGKEGLDARTAALQRSGSAEEASRTRLNNLKGDMEQLNGSIESAMIAIGEKLANNAGFRAIVQNLTSMVNQAVPIVVNMASGIGQAIGTAVTFFRQFAAQAAPSVDQLKTIWASMAPSVTSAINMVKSVFSTLAPYVVAIVNGLKPVMAAIGPVVTSALTVIVAVWETRLKPALDAMRPLFTAVFGFIGSAVANAMNIVSAIFKAVAALMRNDVPGAVGILLDAFKNAGANAAQAITNLVGGVLKALVNLVPGMSDAGRQAVLGFITGIQEKAAAAIQKAREFVGGVIDSVKKTLNIHSPSRVMQELGEYTAEGFVQGIESNKPKVRAAAQNTAQEFLQAFRDLKNEKNLGEIDLSTYIATLQKAADAIRAKRRTLEEGSDAYSNYTRTLRTITDELTRVEASQERTTRSTQNLTNKTNEARAAIEQREALEAYAKRVDAMSDAQLKAELTTQRLAGSTERYNVVKKEAADREKAVEEATQKTAAARERAQQQLADNRASIAATEAAQRYQASLDGMTVAQLKAEISTQRMAGNVQKYNAASSELADREKAAADAVEKANQVRERAAQQLADNRASIAATEANKAYQVSLDGMTEAALRTEIALQKKLANVQKWNQASTELAQREKDAADAAREQAEAQEKAAKQLADNRATIDASVYAEKYAGFLRNASDEQLKNAAATAYTRGEVETYNKVRAEQARRAKEVEDAETAARKAAEEHARQVEANKKAIADRIAWDAYLVQLGDMTESQLALEIQTAKNTGNMEKYNAAMAQQAKNVATATKAWEDYITAQIEVGKKTEDIFTRNVNPGSQQTPRTPTISLDGLLPQIELLKTKEAVDDFRKSLLVLQVQGDLMPGVFEEANAALDAQISQFIEVNTNAQNVTEAYGRVSEAQNRVVLTLKDLLPLLPTTQGEMGNFTTAMNQLAAAGTITADTLEDVIAYAKAAVNEGERLAQSALFRAANPQQATGEVPGRTPGVTQPATDATAVPNRPGTTRPAATEAPGRNANPLPPVEETVARTQAVQQYGETLEGVMNSQQRVNLRTEEWQKMLAGLRSQEYTERLKKMTDAELVLERTYAERTQNVQMYERVTSEMNRRIEATTTAAAKKEEERLRNLADAEKLVASSTNEVNKALGEVERPWQKQIDALEAARGQSDELDVKINALVASMKGLQAQAERQQGLDRLKSNLEAVSKVAHQVFEMFGADSNVLTAIDQFTSAAMSGVDAMGKFASGDILGGVSSVLEGLVNIGNAIDALDPGLAAWKKNLTEIAALEKSMAGQRNYGNIQNPYFGLLNEDAIQRERTAAAGFWQRLGWAIFGGAPQYLNDAAARFMAQASQVFGEVATVVVNGMDNALMNAWETTDWSGAEAAMDKALNTYMAQLTLQAIVKTSDMERKIQAYSEARTRAAQDGIMMPAELAELDQLMLAIREEQRRIAQEFKDQASKLPGYGSNAPKPAEQKPAEQEKPKPVEQPKQEPIKLKDRIPEEKAHGSYDTEKRVTVNLPSVSGSINFDVLATLAGVVDRAAPRFETGGKAALEAGGMLMAGMERLDRIVSRLESAPSGTWR